MKSVEINRSKTATRPTNQRSNNNLLNFTPFENLNITIKKFSKNNLSNKLKLTDFINSKDKIVIKKKQRPFSSKFFGYNMPISNSKKELENKNAKRNSVDLAQRNTIKYYKNFSIKTKRESLFKNKKPYQEIKISSINALENNIKNVINDIRVKIEKKNKLLKRNNTLAPTKIDDSNIIVIRHNNNKSPNRKKSQRRSVGIDEIQSSKNVFDKIIVKKRHYSYDFNERSKIKLMKNIQKKIFKKYKKKISIFSDKSSEDDSDNDYSLIGISFDPNSSFIYFFDLILIIAELYYFIFLPLNAARNKDIRQKESIILEICYYLVDLIFLLDFLISLFRGYYNYQMKLILNNEQIINHYLKRFFISDLLESIPIYSIIKVFIGKSYEGHFGESDYRYDILKIFLFVKPLKIFKIISKKQNKALEHFYSYFIDNYFLEQLIIFLIYFLTTILFVHLFICLHIYLAYKSYPNWLSHTNNIDSVFFSKYITSFYFLITTMTTVGYGDIVCISFIERIYHIFLLVIGTLLYTFLVSKIGNYLRDQSHEQIKLSRDLNILESIRVSYPKMPFKLYSKIQNHLISLSRKRKTTGISILINDVPETIKKDLLFKIYSDVIKSFTVFRQVNNSNFIYQVLTSFIPIAFRKEEIILMEGEFIENIIFLKDGLLTLEISIELKDVYKSIRNYIENNFKGISKKEQKKRYNYNGYKRRNSVISLVADNNYDDLKDRLENVLLDKNNSLNNNSKNDSNNISFDLGRMSFSKEPVELNSEHYKILRIMDIRKNEYFGDIHMFLEQRSPFTIKTKTRIADVLFIRKIDAIYLSRNFPNVIRRIQAKSFHNLIAMKKLAFKALRQYYDDYLFNKKRKSIRLNLGLIKKKKNTEDNFPKMAMENGQDKNISNSVAPNNSFKEKKNLSINTKKDEKKNYKNPLINKISFGGDSRNLFSESDSPIQFPNAIINKAKKESEKDIMKYQQYKSNNASKAANSSEKKELEIILSKNETKKLNDASPSPKNNIINKTKSNNAKYKSSFSIKKNKAPNNISNNSGKKKIYSPNIKSEKKIVKFNLEEEDEENFDKEKYKTKLQKNDIKNSIKEILSLKNNKGNLLKRIKYNLKIRKKIQKLIQYLNKQKYKLNKNLIELYLKQNSIDRKSSNNIIITNKLNIINSLSTSKKNISSEVVKSSANLIDSSNTDKNITQSNTKELNIITRESFEIKASYKNINFLSKGKMINDTKYKLFIENFVKNVKNEDTSKIITSLAKEDTKLSMKENIFKISEVEKKVIKNNQYYSEVKLPLVSPTKKNLERPNNSAKKNYYDNLKTTENIQNSVSELKSSKMIKNSTKFFGREKLEKSKPPNIVERYKNEKNINIKNDNNVVNNIKIFSLGKTLFKSKKTNKSKKEKGKNNNMEIFLDKLDELNNDNNSKNEKISVFGDKNNDASRIKMINSKNNCKEKDVKCKIY